MKNSYNPKYVLNNILGKFGYILTKKQKRPIPLDLMDDTGFLDAYKQCRPYTKLQPEAVHSLWNATEYVVKQKIPGAIVECGVWRGGAMMASALRLRQYKDTGRKLFLYDTYEGMSEPTDKDINFKNHEARGRFEESKRDGYNTWDYSPLSDVQKNLWSTGYPRENIIFIKGMVEDTLPKNMPGKIAILRIDTDWYESTKHILKHLYPYVADGGIVIFDDYGVWRGARLAVEEYIKENNLNLLLHRIDSGVRIAVKPN